MRWRERWTKGNVNNESGQRSHKAQTSRRDVAALCSCPAFHIQTTCRDTDMLWTHCFCAHAQNNTPAVLHTYYMHPPPGSPGVCFLIGAVNKTVCMHLPESKCGDTKVEADARCIHAVAIFSSVRMTWYNRNVKEKKNKEQKSSKKEVLICGRGYIFKVQPFRWTTMSQHWLKRPHLFGMLYVHYMLYFCVLSAWRAQVTLRSTRYVRWPPALSSTKAYTHTVLLGENVLPSQPPSRAQGLLTELRGCVVTSQNVK